jgi:hypothetical protein
MQTIKEILSAQIRAAFAAAFPDADLAALNLGALPAADESFGDYQCNGAMAAAKVLRRPPRAVAEAVVAHLPAEGLVAKADIAGPGFINFTLSDAALARHLEAVQADPQLGVPQPARARSSSSTTPPQRRQAHARRAHPLDRHRRRPQAHPPRPRLRGARRQPSRRLGQPSSES